MEQIRLLLDDDRLNVHNEGKWGNPSYPRLAP